MTAEDAAAFMVQIDNQGRNEALTSMKTVAPTLMAGRIATKDADPLTAALEHAALYAALGQASGDPEGSLTKGMTVAMINALRDVTKDEAPQLTTTKQRLDFVRSRPDLQEDVWDNPGTRGPNKLLLEALITDPNSPVSKLFDNALAEIEVNKESYRQAVKEQENFTPEIAHKTLSDAAAANIQKAEREPKAGRDAFARELLFGKDGMPGTLARARAGFFGWMDDWYQEQVYSAKVAGGEDPELVAKAILEERRNLLRKDSSFGDRKSVDALDESTRKKIQLIDDQQKVLDRATSWSAPPQTSLDALLANRPDSFWTAGRRDLEPDVQKWMREVVANAPQDSEGRAALVKRLRDESSAPMDSFSRLADAIERMEAAVKEQTQATKQAARANQGNSAPAKINAGRER